MLPSLKELDKVFSIAKELYKTTLPFIYQSQSYKNIEAKHKRIERTAHHLYLMNIEKGLNPRESLEVAWTDAELFEEHGEEKLDALYKSEHINHHNETEVELN